MNRKPFIIGGIALVVVVIVCVVVAMIASKTESSLKKSLNSYANYLLYGAESDARITQKYLGVNYRYYVIEQSLKDDSDSKAEYFDKLLQKYDDFLLMSEQNKKLSDEQRNNVTLYHAQLRAFSNYSMIDRITEEAVLQYFATNGYNKTQAVIETQYNDLVNSQDETASILGDYLVREAMFFLDLGVAYKEVGCMVGSSVDMNCIGNSNSALVVQNDDNITSVQDGITLQLGNLKDAVLGGYWRLYNGL